MSDAVPIDWCDECGCPKPGCNCPTRWELFFDPILWWFLVRVWIPLRQRRPLEWVALKIGGRARVWARRRRRERVERHAEALSRAIHGFDISPEWERVMKGGAKNDE